MSDLDSTILRAATQLSVLNGHLVTLLEQLNQQLTIENELMLASANSSRVHTELLNALELQKQVVEENFALVRSMLREQRRHRRATLAQQRDGVVPKPQERSVGPRGRLVQVVGKQTPRQRKPNLQSFTKRQLEIINFVRLGYDNREIAASLCLAEQTVKNHLCTIFGKAGVSRRSDLAMQTSRLDDFPTSAIDNSSPGNQAGTQSLASASHN